MALNTQTQYFLINCILSSQTLLGRVKPALKPEYFDAKYRKIIAEIVSYSDKYNSVPSVDYINSINEEKDVTYYVDQNFKFNKEGIQFAIDMIDKHTHEMALSIAVMNAADVIAKGDTSSISTMIEEAQRVGVKKNVGINFWEEQENWLKKTEKEIGTVATGWENFDKLIDGGFGWGQLIYAVSSSGGGKSLALANLALNFAKQGYNVAYYTFELAEELVAKRVLSMCSNVAYRNLSSASDVAISRVNEYKEKNKIGRLQVIDMPHKSTINDIDSSIRDLEIEFNCHFSIVILDYADLMASRDRRINPNDISLTGRAIAEDIRGWAKSRTKNELQTCVITASQVSKDAMSEMELQLSDLSGSMWKINTADLVFSVKASRQMKEQGKYEIKILKNRNGGAVEHKLQIGYDPNTLLMSDTLVSEEDGDNSSSGNTMVDPKQRLMQLSGIK